MDNTAERALALHEELGGKIYTGVTKKIRNMDDLSLVYTPGVAAPCLAIAKDPTLAKKLTINGKFVFVLSDGSAVLGLGNIGAKAGLPVMEGKAVLFKSLGGVDAFPLCIDTQDTEEIIKFAHQVAPTCAGINLEDISAPRCFEIEQRLRAELDIPVMHDDQWGTATVVLAGLINAMRVRGFEKETADVVINGAGAAGIAITKLMLLYGFKHITVVDTKGAIYKRRPDLKPEGGTKEKYLIAERTNLHGYQFDLKGALWEADIFIGVSAPNIVSAGMVKDMHEDPIIFAMSNPIPEILPSVAHEAGAFIIGTGSSKFPNQVNNSLVFPGFFRGVLDAGIVRITDEMFICAAEALAGMIKHPRRDKILPFALNKKVPKVIAEAIKKYKEDHR